MSNKKSGLLFVPFMTGKGGTERVIQNLYQEMALRNDLSFQLKLISIGGSDDYDWATNIPKKIINVGKTRIARTIFYATCLPALIFFLILKNRTSFIVSTNPVMWAVSKMSCKILHRKTKVIAWYHYSLLQKPIQKSILDSADAYLAISSGIEQQIVDAGIDRDDIYLIFNPVNTSGKIIERPAGDTKFLYIGRMDLDGQKNLRELFMGLSKVSGKWSLETYGDDTYRKELTDLAKTLNIDKNIVFNGFKNDLWDKVEQTSALVLTSKFEGLPMVLCEAISHGIYCISSDIDTGPSDIINSDNGRLYQSGNLQELAGDLQYVIDSDDLPDGEDIKKTAEKFNPRNYLNRFEEAIKDILS